MAFLEEDDPFSPAATAPEPRRGPPDRDRQILVRRLIAVVIGLLILILIVLGVRGCLNARKERAFENYVRDLDALASESQQLSTSFFERLDNPENLQELEFEAEIKADRGFAEGLVDRAENLDTPGELQAAQANLVLSFELRRDGLAEISNEIGTALGDEGSEEAIAGIAEDMQFFVASDVLYRRAQQEIDDVLADQCPTCGEAPSSQFLPDVEWLDETTVAEALGQVTGEENAGGGIHGLGLVPGGVIYQPGDVALTEGAPVTVSSDGEPAVEVQVENQGDSDESDVTVTVELDGSEAGEGTIDTIAQGEIATVEVPLDPAPAPGDSASIDVIVAPVPGEQVADNNEAAFEITVE